MEFLAGPQAFSLQDEESKAERALDLVRVQTGERFGSKAAPLGQPTENGSEATKGLWHICEVICVCKETTVMYKTSLVDGVCQGQTCALNVPLPV